MPSLPTKTILDPKDVEMIHPDLEVLKYVDQEEAKQAETLPFAQDETKLYLLTTNQNTHELQTLKTHLTDHIDKKIVLYYTSQEGIEQAFTRYDQRNFHQQALQAHHQKQRTATGQQAIETIQELYTTKQNYTASDFIMELIRLGYQSGASDIHFQPEKTGVYMKVRIDGVLQQILTFSHKEFYPYCKKLKFIAGTKMNVDYIPQDGRCSFKAYNKAGNPSVGDVNIDVRVSIMPGIQSESLVLRYLDAGASISSLDALGFHNKSLQALQQGIQANFGLILLTGPTGSGKTTTLYTLLNKKNDGKRKIITLENPIEYHMDGIQQSQINYGKGYDFLNGLKACLRHDPDVILVGETRTPETAETIVNAALTGHLVLTTLHTNNALEAIQRLMSMKVKPYMVGPSLKVIVAQRLVRKLCPHCQQQREATQSEKTFLTQKLSTINAVSGQNHSFNGLIPIAGGCEHCQNTGYKGRIAIVEVLYMTEEMQHQITQKNTKQELLQMARKGGFLTIEEDAVLKVLQGATTIEEVRRVL